MTPLVSSVWLLKYLSNVTSWCHPLTLCMEYCFGNVPRSWTHSLTEDYIIGTPCISWLCFGPSSSNCWVQVPSISLEIPKGISCHGHHASPLIMTGPSYIHEVTHWVGPSALPCVYSCACHNVPIPVLKAVQWVVLEMCPYDKKYFKCFKAWQKKSVCFVKYAWYKTMEYDTGQCFTWWTIIHRL